MTYEEAKVIREQLYAELDRASDALKGYPKGPMGLTPDHIKFSPEYRAKKQAFDLIFSKLRAFNGHFVKLFKKEIQAERRLKYANQEMN